MRIISVYFRKVGRLCGAAPFFIKFTYEKNSPPQDFNTTSDSFES